MPPTPILALKANSVGAGFNLNAEGLTGRIGYQRGRLGADVVGGTTWQRQWYAGVRATWDF